MDTGNRRLYWDRLLRDSTNREKPVLILSGSIGLEPLAGRLEIPDLINHLDPVRLGPWDRDTSVACFGRLADSHELPVEGGAAGNPQ